QVALVQGLSWIAAIPVIGFNVFTRRAAELSAAIVGWLGLWNALGRLIVGWVSDWIGRRSAMLANFLLTAFVMFLTPRLTGNAWAMLAMYLLIGLSFGGTLTIFPAITADWFGTKHAGANYGIIFLGWGLGGVIGPFVGDLGLEALGDYQIGFVCAAGLGVLAAALALFIEAPTGQAKYAMPVQQTVATGKC
ncbi:MAG: MFS transporter, partial [Chloroflexota bacterium]|nr:MFS transporter [Chloroflexota bacterium]